MRPTRQERDRPNLKRAVLVGIATLVVFGFGIVSSWLTMFLKLRVIEPNGPNLPRLLGQREIGLVNQRLFGEQAEGPRLARKQRLALESYGWSDRTRARIHVPIEVAMEAIAKGQRP
ncbi:MAG: hypothetical protein ACYCWW_05105 [Deltaproteobacteria bacterium]